MEKITGMTSFKELPDKAKRYIDRLEKILNVGFSIISTGAKRDQTIFLD